jgi:hypothetical protein
VQKTVGPTTTKDRALILDHTQRNERAPAPPQRPADAMALAAAY